MSRDISFTYLARLPAGLKRRCRFQQQLQIMESLQQAALQSLMFLQGQQTQSQGHDPTRSDDLSQTEMLQRVGCSRMRAAIMQQVTLDGGETQGKSRGAATCRRVWPGHPDLTGLVNHDSSRDG